MTDEKYKPWTDANGQYFSWLEELWALDAEQKARNGGSQESLMIPASELRLPKLSFLVDCLKAIRGNPDLMSKISDLARLYPTPDQLPEDSTELAHLIRMFLTWFELKRDLNQYGIASPPSNPIASGSLYRILYDQERGSLRCSDAEAIRQEVLPGFFLDDLKGLDQKDRSNG